MLNMLFEPLHNTLCLISFKLHNVIEQRNGRSRQAEKINLKEKWAFQCLFSKKLTFLQDKQRDLILSEELWLKSPVQDTKLERIEKKSISFSCFNMPLVTNAVFKSLTSRRIHHWATWYIWLYWTPCDTYSPSHHSFNISLTQHLEPFTGKIS